MHCCRVWAGWRKEASRVEEFVRDSHGGGVGRQVEHEVRIVYFRLSNGPFSFLFSSVREDLKSIQNLPSCCLSVNSGSQHLKCLRVLAIFMKAFF